MLLTKPRSSLRRKALSLTHPFAHQRRLEYERQLANAMENALKKMFKALRVRITDEVERRPYPGPAPSWAKELKDAWDIFLDTAFWEQQSEIARGAIVPIGRQIVLGGVEEAATLVGAAVDMDRVNADVLKFTREFSNEWWEQLESARRRSLREALTTWQEDSLGTQGLPDLIDSLQPLFNRTAAERIAVTETTRLFSEGNLLAWQRMPGIAEVEWATCEDELVCPICGPDGYQGKRWPVNKPGAVPPAHVNCRCSLLPVEDDGETVVPEPEPEERPWDVPFAKTLPKGQTALMREYWERGTGSSPQQKHHNIQLLREKMEADKAELTSLYNDLRTYGRSVSARYDDPATNMVDTIIAQWSWTSADMDVLAIALQHAVAEEFGLTNAWDPASRLLTSIASDVRVTELLQMLEDDHMSILRKFVRAEYDVTQDWFARSGITHLRLYRGASWSERDIPNSLQLVFSDTEWGESTNVRVDFQSQPASSFAWRRKVANEFTGWDRYKSISNPVVPVERILSTARTGRGCLQELECIVLGGFDEMVPMKLTRGSY